MNRLGAWRLLSGDKPGHPAAGALLLALLVALAAAPFLFPGTKSLDAAARICIFVVLAASYDMLLGYTGIVSFAHTMFFAFGAYGVAIPLASGFDGWGGVIGGTLAGAALAAAVAAAVALLSLRVQRIFFSMITLAVASLAQLVATQWRDLTGGEDGLTFSLPALLSPAFRLWPDPVLGVRFTGRVLTYYLIFAVALGLFLLMLRIVNSPFGRVLQAIRENEFRAEALGYRTVVYRTIASALSAAIAAAAGGLMALLLRYNGPAVTLSFDIMVDILLMVVIGGMGTLYGPALGAAAIVMAHTYLQGLLEAGHTALAGVPLLSDLVHPDRWLLWLGTLFVLVVYFLPGGIVGTLRLKRSASPQSGRHP
jgi:branched-chain amino acid transport system permease protein